MASGSPRTRIDQFFASKKKKKSLSSSLKPGRGDKDPKATLEASPSAKGSLDSYVVTSQDDNCSDIPLCRAHVSSDREGLVKRSLTLEISSLTSYGNGNVSLSAPYQPQNSEAYGKDQKEGSHVTSCVGDISDRALVNSESAVGAGNSELKQFATDFLSLYCSERPPSLSTPLEPKVSAHKRQGSPSLLVVEDKSSKKRHCIVDGNESQAKIEATCYDEKDEELVEYGVIPECGEAFIKGSRGMNVDTHMVEIHSSLRKCNTTLAASLYNTECDTPGLTTRACGTPKSTRGSSIFSPGEAFWNEAIEVADGFLVTNDGILVPVAGELSIAKKRSDIKDTKILGSVGGDDASNKILDEGASRVLGVEMNASMRSAGKHGNSLDEEASPLPVKHFSFEDKNMDEETLYSSSADNNNALMHKQGKQQVQELPLVSDAAKQKVGTLRRDHESITSSTPYIGKRNLLPNSQNNEDSTPSSSVLLKNHLDLRHWLPSEICSTYVKKGISQLYSWQVDCLQVDGVLERRNLVYCASTSAGKSFVAEILMLRRVLSTGKMALLVLPYVSICAEKAEHLEALLEPLGKHVRSYYGNQGGGTLPKDTSVSVCTIEKANSLINRLLEEGRLSEVGIIVIDELHMVGDQSRGYLLELMLTKLRYAAGEGNGESSSGESSGMSSGKNDPAHGLQIIGMSATLPNVSAVADWLQASLYQTDFRPVPLEEYIKVGNTIYDKKMDVVRTISKTSDLSGKDPDHIVELCNEVVQEGNSVLIFCSSRKGCESTARHVAKFLRKFPASAHDDKNESIDVTSAIDSLGRSPAGLDPILEETLPFGVAYHHAGLTVEERETVETCYRRGLVRVLTATSTLAAGVNLPARRVIFRQPRIGREFIDGTRYRQMAGRAGRTGIDTKGESVLICKPEEVKRIIKIVNDSCPPLHSCLSDDKNGMTHAILEVVAGGIVQTASDIHRYVRCTLLNSTKPFEDVVKSAQDSLKWLCHRKFLEWNEDTKLYSTTPLGRASFGSSLCPEESLIVLDDLSRAREGFVLASDLHLVYLVTPTNVEVEPDWELYYERFMELSALDQSVGNRVGVVEPFLMRMAHHGPMRTANRSRDNTKGLMGRVGMTNHNMLSDEQTLRMCKRFYVALILSRLVQEIPVAEVCEAFKVARGMVQALQENAGRFASMVSVFCERLGWHDLEGLVSKFQNRVSFGVRAEIVELTSIPFVKGSRARALYKAGLRTPQAIAEASVSELVKALFEYSSWTAQENSAQRRIQLSVAKKIKNGARKIVLDKAEEARVAAFSAFKSLGLDVPEFSRPLSLKVAGDAIRKEATTSSGEDSTGSFVVGVGVQHTKHSSKLIRDGSENLDKLKLEVGQEKSTKAFDVPLGISDEAKSAAIMQTNFGAENPAAVEGPVILDEKNTTVNHIGNVVTSSSGPLLITGNENRTFDEYHERVGQERHDRENACFVSKENASSDKGPVSAVNISGGFDSFLDLWDTAQEFYFDIHFSKRPKGNSSVPFEIHGIAICWENSPVYYVNLPKDLFWFKRRNDTLSMTISGDGDGGDVLAPKHRFELAMQRWNRIVMIMGRKDVKKYTWNLKVQIQVFKVPAVSIQRLGSLNLAVKTLGLELVDSSYYVLSPVFVRDGLDMCIVAWILWPDEERSSNPNLEKEVKKRLSSEAAAAASRSGRWKNQMRIAAHNGCCRRVAQTRALYSVLWKLLISEGLVEALLSIEIPLVNILADMEVWGIGVDMEGCLQARQMLGRKLRYLEKEAYRLAGMTFSLYSAPDIANVLYGHLKLPIPEGSNKAKQHPSTDKHCLNLLRHEHPIIPVIKEHRSLAKLLNCTLGSICSLARLSIRTQKYMLHGHWLQTSTATGRLSMEEPNLQSVEHMVEFENYKDGDDSNVDRYCINARDFFVPTEDNWLLLAADYSQIELRLMAHFSKDTSLIELLSKSHGDIFTMIAAKWTEKEESTVTSQERDQTKRLVYGILYGMGPNTLSEQLNCSLDDAAEKIQNFKRCFPGVASWLQEAVAYCRQKGYVKTLKGRKRFLAKIKLGNSKERSKAQRQAVNSICQGSAADIIKIAMINIHSQIVGEVNDSDPATVAAKFHMLRGRCRILLQVHDELVLEADPSVIMEAGWLLQMSMERAASLLVPLRVKMKVGRAWGSLEPFLAEQNEQGVLVPSS
ncbi:helicase and polymerase-containing protein TEBICHI isoform X1 [Rhododendron vialii]|uniref:helicase and polymerase-containing protein TEBICHI isoform X1 n=1 Tax=Rhododendron vialii TaxID=182163 RepID=UPI00265EFC55|nr:helicase and polymerase-containing protein TEBICHI isoform X1 [Rhododendron vialii]XP_058200648.1 helicase and polymerase-containing protein TEBICHI isoform X1 [Rhododendron vialii]XP_058200649.1 helicase and polymerase-containing protein TEBICHI isoform X1 [Rhododendron vialii]XP_058200650.1 helicase and polymerase-containing protein TEBICHI isoform X1 [Rhododendron vialii]